MNNSEKKEILFLARWYPPESGHFIEDIAQAISIFCHVTVIVAVPNTGKRLFKHIIDVRNDPEFQVRTVNIQYGSISKGLLSRAINPILYFLAQIHGYLTLRQLNLSFDVVHVHVLTRSALFALLLNFFRGIPYVITEYWTRYLPQSNGYHGFIRKKITSFLVRKAASVICISQYLMDAMIEQGLKNGNYHIIPLAIRTDQFISRGPLCKEIPKRILHISTFKDHAKNIHGILRAAKKLSLKRRDFELHLIGGTSDFLNETIEFAKSIDPEGDFVVFHKAVYGKTLVEEIWQACFLVMFSNYETFCAVIQECFSCGIPVVASNAGAVPEYFNNNGGILVDTGDEEALVDALDYMLDHYGEFNPEELRDYVINRFSFNIIGKKYYQLYKQISG